MPTYLISYDISHASRRNKAALRLEKLGIRLQKSVYLVKCGAGTLAGLEQELQQILAATDSLLIAPLCATCLESANISAEAPPKLIIV